MASKRGLELGPIIADLDRKFSSQYHGTFTDIERERALEQWLKDHPRFHITERAYARQQLRAYQTRINPKPGSPGGIYHPLRIIQLGKGLVCCSRDVSAPVFDLWKDRLIELNRRHNEVHEARLVMVDQRRNLMLRHDIPTWHQCEIDFFDYEPPPHDTIPPEILDADFDGDDDDGEDDE